MSICEESLKHQFIIILVSKYVFLNTPRAVQFLPREQNKTRYVEFRIRDPHLEYRITKMSSDYTSLAPANHGVLDSSAKRLGVGRTSHVDLLD